MAGFNTLRGLSESQLSEAAGGLTLEEIGGALIRASKKTGVNSTAWSTTWDTSDQKDFGEYTVSAPIAIVSSDIDSVVGGYSQATIVADGTNIPTFDGVTISEFVNTAGTRNLVQLFRSGNSKYWAVGSRTGVAVVTPSAPTWSTAPVISAATEGSAVTIVSATADGSAPITYTYQWLLNGADIVGETNSTYTPIAADVGGSLTLEVTATNSLGSAVSISNAVVVEAITVSSSVAVRMLNIPARVTETGNATDGWNYTNTEYVNYSSSTSFPSDKKIPTDTDGYFEYEVRDFTVGDSSFLFGVKTTNTSQGYQANTFSVFAEDFNSNFYRVINPNGTQQNTTRLIAEFDIVRIERVGTNLLLKVSSNGGTSFDTIHTVTGITNLELYATLMTGGLNTAGNIRGEGVV